MPSSFVSSASAHFGRLNRVASAGLLACLACLAFASTNVLAQASCQLPTTITSPSARQPDWTNADVPTDYLALVLSWSPEHCAAQTSASQRAKHAFQCQLNRFEFVVHGLWPQSQQAQSAKDHPRHCKASGPLPVELLKRHLCSVPGTDLMQNEWQAHGTCAWPDASSYFNSVESLLERFKRPDFGALTGSGGAVGTASTTPRRIKQAFASANPGVLSPEHLRVSVASGNRLKEIWICLSAGNNPQPIACPPGGTPDTQSIKVRAPQPAIAPLAQPQPDIAEPAAASDISCPARQKRFAGYGSSAKQALWAMYANGGETIYCKAPFRSASTRQTEGGLQVNIEHVLPKSSIKASAGQGDLHNLWPSILKVNEARGSFALTDSIPGEHWTYANAQQAELRGCDFEVESIMRPGGKVTVVEPAPHARGRLARATLHMALAYGVRLTESEWSMYLRWHEQAGPGVDEQRRNDQVEQAQGTRNPFIDFPEYARLLVQSRRP